MRKPGCCLFLVSFCCVILSSCAISFVTKNNALDDKDVVFADFGKEPTTVLVVRHKETSVNEELEKVFRKYYTGQFEMVDEKDLVGSKYNDTLTYRYTFRIMGGSSTSTSNQWVGKERYTFSRSNGHSYYFSDRLTSQAKEMFYVDFVLLDAFVIKLEKQKKANAANSDNLNNSSKVGK